MTTYKVTTQTLRQACDQLDRAVLCGGALVDDADAIRAAGADWGDPDLARALARFVDEWSWGLRHLLRQTGDLAYRTRAVAQLYEEVERDNAVRLVRPGGFGSAGRDAR